MENQIQTEEVTVQKSQPQHVVTKVTKVTPPPVQTGNPQKTYEKKKVIFRSYQVIWYILGIVEFLLGFRFLLKVIGANPLSGFTNLIYTLSDPLALPFSGVVSPAISGPSVFEWSTAIAALVYILIAWGIIKLFEFIKPVGPNEVEREVDSNS